MIEWDEKQANALRESGMSWAAIGRRFGVSCSTAHMRLDPAYADHRRKGINDRRRSIGRAPAIVPDLENEVIETGRKVYSVERIRLTPDGIRRTRISLPYISIQHSAASERTA